MLISIHLVYTPFDLSVGVRASIMALPKAMRLGKAPYGAAPVMKRFSSPLRQGLWTLPARLFCCFDQSTEKKKINDAFLRK